LLVGSGNALSKGGPAGVLISFSLVGIIVFFVMQSLGEMATLIPVTGSFTEYAQRFIDDSLAFGLGWAYWYLWVTVGRTCSSTVTVSPDHLGPCQ
jgi:amino acid transporter